jgi:hypothetical protein
MSIQSVDDLLINVENSKLGVEIPPVPSIEPVKEEAIQSDVNEENVLHETSDHQDDDSSGEDVSNKDAEKEVEQDASKDQKEPKNIDEYGNPIKKSRTYSEEEVQKMIRERLARGRHADQSQNQQQNHNTQNDNQSEDGENWDVQLKQFVKQAIQETQQEESERLWRHQEAERQAEFESKFTSGMAKYNDFQDVVRDRPITDTMLLAVRNLKDPAAFIYGASKLHPQEIDRISRISDPYAQATELGRLHEKMVKIKNNVSRADKPIDPPKGALPNKGAMKPSLEERIHAYAKQKRR